MAERFRFGKEALRAMEAPADRRRVTVYDTLVPKLALRMTASGAQTFYVVKRAGNSVAWVRLGAFPDMTVEQARVAAQKALGEFAAGENPAAVRRAVRGEPTFGDAFEEFLAGKRKRDGSPLGQGTKRDYRDVLRLYLDSIKRKKLSEITRAELKVIHARVSRKSPAQADRAIAMVSSLFTYMLDQERFDGANPAARVQKNLSPSRDRFATASELPSLMAAIELSPQRDYFLLSLLTGARRSNVQAMRWKDIDLDRAIWRIEVTKNGTPQNLPLSPEAVVVLRDRKEGAAGERFVFPGTGASGHLVEPKRSWITVLRMASLFALLKHLHEVGVLTSQEYNRGEHDARQDLVKSEKGYQAVAKEAGVDSSDFDMTDLRLHDLRRTLGSWQAITGASLPIIGKSLNHKSQQATAIYARLDLDPVRESVRRATEAMMRAAGVAAAPDDDPDRGRGEAG